MLFDVLFSDDHFLYLDGKKIKYLIIGGWDKREVSLQNKTQL